MAKLLLATANFEPCHMMPNLMLSQFDNGQNAIVWEKAAQN